MLHVALLLLQAASSPPVAAWTVRPESVTVAEPFTVTVTVRAPSRLGVTFPPGPDSAQAVEAVDPPAVTSSENGEVRTAVYRLVAWQTGTLVVPLAAVAVGDGASALRLDVEPRILVTSVLPADSAQRVPRPALGVIPGQLPWWVWVLPPLVFVVLAWAVVRRRKRRAPAPPPTAIAVAQGALARVDALGLLEAGEPTRYLALTVEALRGYLSARVPQASRAQTSGELLAAVLGYGLPNDRIRTVLEEEDQVQFARRSVSADRARAVAREVQALLEACEEHFAKSVPAPGARPPGPRKERAA